MSSLQRKVAIVFDTSTLIRATQKILSNGKIDSLNLSKCHLYTTESVISELKSRLSRILAQSLMTKISILTPKRSTIQRIVNVAKKMGEILNLSDTDIEIIALAYDLKKKYNEVYVASEDFSIQNLCRILNVKILSVSKKIKHVIKRLKKCIACNFIYNYSLDSCPICGCEKYIVLKRRKK